MWTFFCAVLLQALLLTVFLHVATLYGVSATSKKGRLGGSLLSYPGVPELKSRPSNQSIKPTLHALYIFQCV